MKEDLSIDISDRHSTHILRLVHDLSVAGWTPTKFPRDAKILRNCQLLELHTPHRSIRLRVSIYKIGGRGEAHRLHQQRIEITTTLASGLPRLRNWADVILGYDSVHDSYVGLDPRRIGLGGETHNASTSIDPSALAAALNTSVLIRPHETKSFGLEYQAIFRPQRLGEYFFNYESIHFGLYRGGGLFSGLIQNSVHPGILTLPNQDCRDASLVLTNQKATIAKRRALSPKLVEACEIEDAAKLANLTPHQLDRILQKCREVGDACESFIYQYECKRLHKAGRSDLADKVEWVSQKAVGKGYDIKSFEVDGAIKYIEVKGTIGIGTTFFISSNEWKVATRLKSSYWIYRVVEALSRPSISATISDPVAAENASEITRVADGWRVTIL